MEYKESLPKKDNDAEKTKFLCTVASLANALGGDVVFGVAEQRRGEKSPGEIYIKGLDSAEFDFDRERNRLTEMILKGIDPRVGRVGFRLIKEQNEKPIIVMRVPRSIDAPHMVIFNGASKFYSRHSGGRYALGVREIRQAFLGSELLQDRIRAFRNSRITAIIAEETPVRLLPDAKIVLHVIPYSAFDRINPIDLAAAYGERHGLKPIGGDIHLSRFNLDGFVVRGGRQGEGDTAYGTSIQVFRNGIVEAVNATILEGNKWYHERPVSIPSQRYEDETAAALNSFLCFLKSLDVEPPLSVMLSLVGVKGLIMALSPSWTLHYPQQGIDRDLLLLPEQVIEEYGPTAEQILKPIFEGVWQAAGFERNFNYDEAGRRVR